MLGKEQLCVVTISVTTVSIKNGIVSSMRILITGGSGMLGRAVTNALLEASGGHMVFAPERAELDLLNQESIALYLAEKGINSIVHCAALVGGIQANIDNPFEYLNTNVRLDSNLMTAALSVNVENFLYMASSCMYPTSASQPIMETELLNGVLEKTNEGYALAKIVGTKSVEAAGKHLNWRTLVLSNLYGPGDKYDVSNSHLLAAIIRKVSDAKASKTNSIQMWGTGNVRREFTFVTDVADYISRIIFCLDKIPQTMNLGAGIDFSVREYYELVCEVANYNGEIIGDISRPEGMLRKLMDSSIANHKGWNPKTDIRTGIRITMDHFELNHKGIK